MGEPAAAYPRGASVAGARHCCGELVQWDTSVHDWLEGRGGRLYLIAMIDDATSRLTARFAPHDTSEENAAGPGVSAALRASVGVLYG